MDIFSRYKAVIENTDCPVVLELGAAEGEDTLRYVEALLALNRPFRYIAFEPDERNIWHLERLREKMTFELCPMAVGDFDGLTPWRSSNHPYSGSVKEPKEHLLAPVVLEDVEAGLDWSCEHHFHRRIPPRAGADDN